MSHGQCAGGLFRRERITVCACAPPPAPLLCAPQVYDAQKGAFTDLGMLDVQQIFGRAGRPHVGVGRVGSRAGRRACVGSSAVLEHFSVALARTLPVQGPAHLAVCSLDA